LRAYHPDLPQSEGERLYPEKGRPIPNGRGNGWGLQIIIAAAFLLTALIVLLCNLQLKQEVTWAGYVLCALGLCYTVLFLPAWFRSPNPVIFTQIGFAAAGGYLLYINQVTEGDWFLSFAFPVVGWIGLLICAAVTILHYVKKGRLYVFGGTAIALGGFMPLMEFLMNLTFDWPQRLIWSYYPLMALVLFGGLLLFFAVCRPARESVERIVFF
jgi:hypothetical protein